MKQRIRISRGHSWLLCLLVWIFLPMGMGGAQTHSAGPKQVQLNEAERAWLQKHPVAYWGVDPNWPPFSSFGEQGRCSGINVEILDLIAKRAGLNLKLMSTPT